MEENKENGYNKDELTPPPFMDRDFFELALRSSENDPKLKIIDHQIVPGTKPGDHFASIMFKVIVSYSSKGKQFDDVSLIVKTMPFVDGIKKEMLEKTTIFETEIGMYTKTLPEMHRLLKSIGDDDEFAPRMIYQSLSQPVIILEDITKKDYLLLGKSLNYDETAKVFLKLAKFHALSFYMHENHVDMNYKNFFVNEDVLQSMKPLVENFYILQDFIKTWPGFETINKKIEDLKPRFLQKLLDTHKQHNTPGDFRVLNHGDFHLKNMMFVMNGDESEKSLFVDYQLCFWGSPAYDINYAMYMLGSQEVRDRRMELLPLYHDKFVETLDKLGCLKKPPTLLELNIEVLKHGFIEVFTALCFMPLFFIDYSKVNMEEMYNLESNYFPKMVYGNKETQEILKEALPVFMYKGLLE